MSSRKLNDTEIKLLQKGLKFTPTPSHSNTQELKNDVLEFTRKVRLIEYFDDTEDPDESLVRNKSNFVPPIGREQLLDNFVYSTTNIPLTPIEKSKIKRNITKVEQKSISTLANDEEIIIKQADKGGATVIMNKSFYQEQIEKMLLDTEYYEKLDENPHKEIMKKYRSFLNKHKAELTHKEYDYLVNFTCNTSNFYGLPKIHKSKEINQACTTSTSNYVELEAPKNLTFRPIVAGPSCETHRLSNLLDILLQPYAKHIKSYIKDTKDFLQKLPTEIPENSILVSFDVVNLYSNIPHELGLEAIKFWLNKFPEELPNRISKEFILKGIQFILENNSFCFNDTYFLQRKGTAMGSKFAPIYATLVLAYLEEKLYEKAAQEFDTNFSTYLERNFKRFLDDCFLIFTRTEEELKQFHNLLNTLHPSIIFTLEQSRKKLSFLDTLIIKNNGTLHTDIYYKPTDSKQYLLYTSCHPKHTRNSIPYNLARRLKMIISQENTLLVRLQELKTFLIKQKYPPKLIEDSIQKIRSLNRKDLLKTYETNSNEHNKVPCVTTFNPHNPEIFPEIRKNKSILLRNERMKKIYDNKTFLKSKRQPPNLKKLLTKAKFTNQPRKQFEVTRCHEPRCGLCKHLKEGPSFEFKDRIFSVNADMTCTVKNVVYVIECRGCGKYYIGETNNLRKRITLHNQHIRHENLRMIPVSGHLASCSNADPKYFVFPFFKMKTDSIIERKEKEKHFIQTYKPDLNSS